MIGDKRGIAIAGNIVRGDESSGPTSGKLRACLVASVVTGRWALPDRSNAGRGSLIIGLAG